MFARARRAHGGERLRRRARSRADKAYLSHANLAAVEERRRACRSSRSRATSGTTGSAAWERMCHYYSLNRDEFLAHYHKRSATSRARSSAIKRKFGGERPEQDPGGAVQRGAAQVPLPQPVHARARDPRAGHRAAVLDAAVGERVSDLTAEEQENVRAALRFLHARCGTWRVVAKALHAQPGTLRHTVRGRTVSASTAVRVARFAGAAVDDVLTGRFPPEGTCPHCGATLPAKK